MTFWYSDYLFLKGWKPLALNVPSWIRINIMWLSEGHTNG